MVPIQQITVLGTPVSGRALAREACGCKPVSGGRVAPHRGLKTLVLRLNHQNRSALEVARFLEGHAAVVLVNHPGLESHPQHERAQSLFSGFGGMLSFELRGGLEASNALLQKLEIPLIAPSLRGVETLVTLPATTTHAGIAREERLRLGISDSLIRVSIGIEATEDIINDFRQALDLDSISGCR